MNYFGTDGIRGAFGQWPMTPEFLLQLGYVAGQIIKAQSTSQTQSHSKKPSVLIGKDTRLSCDAIEAALQAGFCSAGVDVYRLGVLPTPAVAHLTKGFGASLGVVISASHNPYEDNGVKFFDQNGKKIDDSTQNAINAKLNGMLSHALPSQTLSNQDKLGQNQDKLGQNPVNQPKPRSNQTDEQRASQTAIDLDPRYLGRVSGVDDACGRYIEFCKGTFAYQDSLHGLTIALDCANGAGYKVAPRVFGELGATVLVFGNTPNGVNINENCGSTHPNALQQFVVQHQADIGIALDGDGDRVILVDKRGNVVDGDGILYVLAMHQPPQIPPRVPTQSTTSTSAPQNSDMLLGVVGTQMSNMALELALKQRGIAFERSKVGDRYVMQTLSDKGWVLGGEPSGHILTLDKAGTGDAIVAALQVLNVMTQTGKSLDELLAGYNPMPQSLVNVRLATRQDPNANAELADYFKQIATALAGTGRLLVRPSGTEPLIRVMVECQDAKKADSLSANIADKIKDVLDK